MIYQIPGYTETVKQFNDLIKAGEAIIEKRREPDEQDTGVCNACGSELEPIIENNGYQPPDPPHYETVGYKLCPCRAESDEL